MPPPSASPPEVDSHARRDDMALEARRVSVISIFFLLLVLGGLGDGLEAEAGTHQQLPNVLINLNLYIELPPCVL